MIKFTSLLVDDSLEIVSRVHLSSACVRACVAMFMVYESRERFEKNVDFVFA